MKKTEKKLTREMCHCGTHGVCFSYPGLAIYVIHFVRLWLENHF